MVSDANADHTEDQHNATLVAFCSKFSDVASTGDLIARLTAVHVRA